ncbi:tRNA-uridine aminocarboxypropyltransferase 2 isoform 3-T3 [Morphnus guianensis]
MAVWLFLQDLCLLSATGNTKSSFWLHWPWVCQMSLSHLEPSSEGVFMSIPANTSAKGLHLLVYNSASSREAMVTDRPVQVSGTVKGRGITYCRTADRSQESRVLRTVPLLAACLPPDKYKILVGRRFSEDRYPELATVCRNPSTLILYPGAEATNLEEVAVMYSSPSVMIIIDGTWSQAKDIFYKNSLFRLPKQNHRFIERPRLEWTSKDNLVHCFVGREACMRLSSTLCGHILKTSSDGDSTMSLARLF